MKSKNKKIYIRLSGYKLTATIKVPIFDAYSLWHSAYLHYLVNHEQNILSFPWPQNNEYVKNRILYSLIDKEYVFISENGLRINNNIKDKLKDSNSIRKYFFEEEEYKGVWWIDALHGNIIPYKVFNKYEVDASETHSKKNVITVKTEKINKFYEVESMIHTDVSELLQTVFKGETQNDVDKAYINNGLIIDSEIKEIEIPIDVNKLIPPDLAKLELLLLQEFPDIFNVNNRIENKTINWHISPVEVFAETLENLSYAKDNSKEKANMLKELLNNKNEWLSWYNNGVKIEAIVGDDTSIQFTALKEICNKTKEYDKLIILSSFFYLNNIKGFADTIKNCNPNTNIIILYIGIALLETTGYMSRVAFLLDGFFHKFGLHGKSFIPLVTGFGCSVPAYMATRTLKNRKRMIRQKLF
jgi:hypothetical protein